MNYVYPAKLTKDEDGYTATFRDVPEAITYGDSKEEAICNAADALEEAIASYILEKKSLPTPTKRRRGEHDVWLPIQTSCKAAIYQAVIAQDISNSVLAKKLNVDEKEVRRILDPHHETKLRRMEATLIALGARFRLDVEIAA